MAERSSSDAAGSEQSASTSKSGRNGRDSPEAMGSPKQPGNGGSSSRAEHAGSGSQTPHPTFIGELPGQPALLLVPHHACSMVIRLRLASTGMAAAKLCQMRLLIVLLLNCSSLGCIASRMPTCSALPAAVFEQAFDVQRPTGPRTSPMGPSWAHTGRSPRRPGGFAS